MISTEIALTDIAICYTCGYDAVLEFLNSRSIYWNVDSMSIEYHIKGNIFFVLFDDRLREFVAFTG